MPSRRLAVVSFAIVCALAGCGSRERPVDVAAAEGRLIVINEAEPKTLDPHLYAGVPESRIFWSIFEGLTRAHPETLEPTPGVAESWDISDDGAVYTFHLREDAKWSNGDPITAGDFVYAWRRILTPSIGAAYASMLYCMEGAEAYQKGETDDPETIGARAIDDHTLEVTLIGPTPYFLGMHTHFTWFPVHQEAIESHGAFDDPANPWTRAGSMVSNGPFKLVDWEAKRIVRVEKNEHYWNADAVELNSVEFLPVTVQQTSERMFRVGDGHVMFRPPSTKIPIYKEEHPELIHLPYIYATAFYRFNVTKPPLDNALVRKALAMTIDREGICNNITRGGEVPTGSLAPPDPNGYSSPATIPHDPDKARELMAEAGYPKGEGFPTIEILYNTLELNKEIAEAIQANWQTELNIPVELLNVEWKVYLERAQGGDFQVARAGWYGDFLDPVTFLELGQTGNGNNWGRWSNAEFDELLRAAGQEPDAAKRLDILGKAETIMLDDPPFAPIYNYVDPVLVSPHVTGWHGNLLAYIDYTILGVQEVAE